MEIIVLDTYPLLKLYIYAFYHQLQYYNQILKVSCLHLTSVFH